MDSTTGSRWVFYIFPPPAPKRPWLELVGVTHRGRRVVRGWPKNWNCPLAVAIRRSVGYQRRPIFAGPLYLQLPSHCDKPSMGRCILFLQIPTSTIIPTAPRPKPGFRVFSPNFKVELRHHEKIAARSEYYGRVGAGDGLRIQSPQQQQQIAWAIDLNLFREWEFNFGRVA